MGHRKNRFRRGEAANCLAVAATSAAGLFAVQPDGWRINGDAVMGRRVRVPAALAFCAGFFGQVYSPVEPWLALLFP
jgi:hypothetical protein